MVVEVENQVVGLLKGSDAGFIQPGASPKGSSYMAKNDKRVKKSDELGQGSNQNNIVGFPLNKSFHSFSGSESEVEILFWK